MPNLIVVVSVAMFMIFGEQSQAFVQDSTSQEPLTQAQLAGLQPQMDQQAPVFVYDSVGGFRRVAPGDFKVTPRLQIFADGKVLTGSSTPSIVNRELQLSDDELFEFLNFVVNENKLYEITNEDLEQRMEATGKKVFLADAPTSKFSLDLQRGKHSVQIYGLFNAKNQFAEVNSVLNLAAIEKEALRLIALAHIGDEEAQKKLLDRVNDQFQASMKSETKPKADAPGKGDTNLQSNEQLEPFTLHDVRFATRHKDGSFRATFFKVYAATDDSPIREVTISFSQASPDKNPDVSVSVRNP